MFATIWLLVALCGNAFVLFYCLSDCLMQQKQLFCPSNRCFSISLQDCKMQQQERLSGILNVGKDGKMWVTGQQLIIETGQQFCIESAKGAKKNMFVMER